MEITQSETTITAGIPASDPTDADDINGLDFSMIKLKLQDTDEGPGWSIEKCEEAEEGYRRFLALKRAYPDRDIVPNRPVDVFWHQHILDTEKYAKDCETIFGYFLHHYPYFGMQGEEDHANLCATFEETAALYAEHFSGSWGSSVKNRAKCRTKCKPMRCK